MPDFLSRESQRLRDQIWNTFPVTQPAFGKLLSLLEIEASREIPTACVSLGLRSRLRINPDFVGARCATDQALVMLVLHELFHVVLGHTRLWDRSTFALNLAFDAVINAQLCLLFPNPEWTALFRSLANHNDLPWALLRPPEGWRTAQERWLPGRLGALHRRLYTDASVSYEELFRLLAEAVEKGDTSGSGAESAGGTLLGSHGRPGEEGGDATLDPDLVAEIRQVIATWPMIEVRSGRDQGSSVRSFRIEERPGPRSAASILRQALRHLGDSEEDGTGRLWLGFAPASRLQPHRSAADRRAAVLEGCGFEPLLFTGEGPRRAFRRGERVHVYLDVSGSMRGVIAPLYAALGALSGWMTPRIHLFSTVVKDVTAEELRRGKGFTTDGTDISVVTEHMVSHGVRRALVVTDGWVGSVPTEHAHVLARRKGRFSVVVTEDGDPSFARGLAQSRVWNLPRLS